MKKLQNNFTTPEQSKRLLELGVPEWTADCYLEYKRPYVIQDEEIYNLIKLGSIFPCWSVGRLIEIDRLCSTLPDEEYMFPFWKDQEDNVDWAIRVLESGIRAGHIYFSELEEYESKA